MAQTPGRGAASPGSDSALSLRAPAGTPAAPALGLRVLRGSGALAARTGLIYAITGIGLIVLTRSVEPRAIGQFVVVLNLSVFIYTCATNGFVQLLVRERVRDERVIDAAFWAIEAVCAAAAALCLAVGFGFGVGDPVLLAGLAAFVLLTPLRFPLAVACTRDLRFLRLASVELLETIVLEVVAVSLAVAGHGVRSFGYALIAAAIVAAATSLVLQWRLPGLPRPRLLSGWLRPLVPIESAVVVGAARDGFTIPLLTLVVGTTAAGLFSWAYTVALIPLVLVVLASNPLLSAFARLRERPAELADALSRATRLMSVGMVALAVPLCAAAEPLTRTVFSERWLPAHSWVWILGGGAVAYGIGLTLSQAALVTGDGAHAVKRWQLVAVLLFWVLGLPLAAALGMRAYAGAYLLAGVVYAALALRHVRARLGVYVLPTVVAVCVAGAFAAVVGALASSAAGGRWLGLAAAIVVSTLLYAGGLAALAGGPLGGDARVLHRLVRPRA